VLYKVSDSITYDFLIINANTYSFLKEVKAKLYKLVKIPLTPDSHIKLIVYFKFWMDLQKAKKLQSIGMVLNSINLIILLLAYIPTNQNLTLHFQDNAKFALRLIDSAITRANTILIIRG
jgi:hypothetical protein